MCKNFTGISWTYSNDKYNNIMNGFVDGTLIIFSCSIILENLLITLRVMDSILLIMVQSGEFKLIRWCFKLQYKKYILLTTNKVIEVGNIIYII